MEPKKTYTIEVKKSKFIGLLYDVNSEEEVKIILDSLKYEYKKASHMPYAYKLINTAKKSDDKEPHNTAGLPILNAIERKNLTNTLIVVVRYFGGVKLGTGPLLRTFSCVANELVKS